VSWITTPVEEPWAHHVYHQYTVRILENRREEVQAELAESGVDSKVYYPVPCHQLPVYRSKRASLPVTETAAQEVLSLPIGPALTSVELNRVVDVLRSVDA
jgi:dTDP-4-amino-4,6-dideoxygalactose transaminase